MCRSYYIYTYISYLYWGALYRYKATFFFKPTGPNNLKRLSESKKHDQTNINLPRKSSSIEGACGVMIPSPTEQPLLSNGGSSCTGVSTGPSFWCTEDVRNSGHLGATKKVLVMCYLLTFSISEEFSEKKCTQLQHNFKLCSTKTPIQH